MPNPYFRFKQFTIRHDRSAMKVGTDGVLLGAWASPTSGGLYLDVGTGTGLIALMLAQRFPDAFIEGIDIDEASVEQAQENVQESPFRSRIEIRKKDFSNINSFSKKYDLIVSNPPFYVEETLGGNEARDAARHTTSLPFETLITNAAQLLHSEGTFCAIIPYQSVPLFVSLCAQNRLYLHRRLDVQPVPHKSCNRSLLAFTTTLSEAKTDTLVLYDEDRQRTEAYSHLTQDFYL